MEHLNIQVMETNRLLPYARNAKLHPKEQVDKIARQISEVGFLVPIVVDKELVVIAGHGRLEAAKALSLERVPVVVADHLTEDQAMAFRIADNKVAESQWEMQTLGFDLKTLEMHDVDLTLTGFTLEELQPIMAQFQDEPSNESSGAAPGEDEVPEVKKVPHSKRGEVWTLGKHRLMCGDATSEEDFSQLMNGKNPSLIFTDPPCGIDYLDVKRRHKKIEGDSTLDGVPKLLSLVLKQECPTFICCNWKCFSTFESAMFDAEKPPKACIVWDKGSRVQNLDKFGKQHEFILYRGPFGGEKTVDVDVWACKREVRADHPTAKPVELIERALGHFDAPLVVDFFGGSGSTMIAAEKLGRSAYLMEIEPSYVDVILERWALFTGQDPIRQDGKLWSNLKAETPEPESKE